MISDPVIGIIIVVSILVGIIIGLTILLPRCQQVH